ncbi:hypothetical protein [Streptomyces sp. NPDC007940]|uniref:hypothetical protein n=1 Tax=Streptomyces sp. NPDC007940 TaxID=3364796 RepID=UPI0036EEE4A9
MDGHEGNETRSGATVAQARTVHGHSSGPLIVGLPACLVVTVVIGSGTGAGQAADASAAGVRAVTPSDTGLRRPAVRVRTAPASSEAAALAGRIKPAVSRQGVATGRGVALRITGIYGEQLTVDSTAVQPYVAQATRVPFARHRPTRRPAFTGPQTGTTAGWSRAGRC